MDSEERKVLTIQLNRTPVDLKDAMSLIQELRNELRVRPYCVVFDPQTQERIGTDRLGQLAVGVQGCRVEITVPDVRRFGDRDEIPRYEVLGCTRYVWQSCVLVETPDEVVDVVIERDNSGNVLIVPTCVRPKE